MKVKVLLIVFIIFGLSFTLFQIFKKDYPVNISQKEAEAIAVKLYGGKVLNTTVNKENNNYQISIDNHKGIYNMYVDGNTKKVSNVRLIKRKESLLTIDEAKKNIEKELNGQVDQIKQVNKKEGEFAEATVKRDDKHYSIEYDLKKKKIVANTEKKTALNTHSNIQMKDHLSKVTEQKNNTNTSLISKEQARNIALQQINGKVTNLSEVTTQNGKHYKVTVDGPLEGAHVYVQANTGKVSSISWYAKAQPKPNPKSSGDNHNEADDNLNDDNDDNDDENSTDNDD